MNAVAAVTHTTVDGKTEYYIKGVNVTTGVETFYPVGKKTHDGIKALGGCTVIEHTPKDENQTELQFEDNATQPEF